MTIQLTPGPKPSHPDVAVLKGVFLSMATGETRTYESVAAAITMDANDPTFRRRSDRARLQLEQEQAASISCVSGVGFVRETPTQTLERTKQRGRPSMRRKAMRIGRQLASVDPAALTDVQRNEYFTERTINNVVFRATGHASHKKIIEAQAQRGNHVLPLERTLEVLQRAHEAESETNGETE